MNFDICFSPATLTFSQVKERKKERKKEKEEKTVERYV